MKKYLIILASGSGSRFGADCPKQYVKICGKMIIEHTLSACDCGLFDEGILVVSSEYVDEMRSILAAGNYNLPFRVVSGGVTRKDSCEKGVACIPDSEALVVIHNGVQPFITKRDLCLCLEALNKYSAVTNGSPCVYTILETNGDGLLVNEPVRSRCYNDLGPECFRLSLLRRLFEISKGDTQFTNFTGIIRKYGLCDIFVVTGSPQNKKITYPEDIIYAERMLAR